MNNTLFVFMMVVLLAISICDYRDKLIPNWLLVLLSGLSFLKNNLSEYLLETILFTIFMIIFVEVCNKLYKKECFGQGDIWLLSIFAFNVGVYRVLYILLLSCILSLSYALANKKYLIPFAPYLTIGFLLVGVMFNK